MEIQTILDRASALASDVLAANAQAVDREARWPEEGIRALQRAGLGGLVIPRAAGGLGQGLSGLARTCEVLAQECASTALCFGMHCVGAAVLAAKATTAQHSYLEAINAGEHLTTLALSEPGTGSHFYFPQTRLQTLSGDRLEISGTKSFVTNGGHADSYVVSTVAADADAPPGQFSCVVVEAAAEGLHWGPPWDGMGMRGNCSRSLELRQVCLPRSRLLGEQGDQIWYIFNVVAPYFLVAMAGTYLGVATAALEEARQHLGKRHYEHSGGLLSQIPVLQHRLGRLWGAVERSRRLVYFAAEETDAGGSRALPALLSAKAEVGGCAVDVVNEAMTLMGGRAYQNDYRLGRLLRDARAAHVMAPTTDILWTWAGRALLDLPLLGE